MSNKIQGEGDYDAARRFNKSEQDFVKHKLGKKPVAKRDDPYGSQKRGDEEAEQRNPRSKLPEPR
jgi:hypothetical protein